MTPNQLLDEDLAVVGGDSPAPIGAVPDSYSAADAARVIGVSERRVRQLVDAGHLPAVPGEGPLRVPMVPVHAERERRRRAARAAERTPAPDSAGGSPDQHSDPIDVEDVVTRTVRSLLPLMLEPAERAEAAARDLLAEEHARRLQAEARAADLEVRARLAEERLAALVSTSELAEELMDDAPDLRDREGRPRRRWFRRPA